MPINVLRILADECSIALEYWCACRRRIAAPGIADNMQCPIERLCPFGIDKLESVYGGDGILCA